jgi:hypothetical protein
MQLSCHGYGPSRCGNLFRRKRLALTRDRTLELLWAQSARELHIGKKPSARRARTADQIGNFSNRQVDRAVGQRLFLPQQASPDAVNVHPGVTTRYGPLRSERESAVTLLRHTLRRGAGGFQSGGFGNRGNAKLRSSSAGVGGPIGTRHRLNTTEPLHEGINQRKLEHIFL